jgi:restriction endonuclease S subunit
MISKQALEHLEVIVPPLEQQHRIVALAALATEEQRLLKELAGKRKQYMEGILMQIASGSQ